MTENTEKAENREEQNGWRGYGTEERKGKGPISLTMYLLEDTPRLTVKKPGGVRKQQFNRLALTEVEEEILRQGALPAVVAETAGKPESSCNGPLAKNSFSLRVCKCVSG